jgi:hypothetical protein
MHQRQLAVTGWFGPLKLQLRQFSRQPLAQELVFAHGKAMAVRQFLNVRGGKVNMHSGLLVNKPK